MQEQHIPDGYCQCGCGGLAPIARQTRPERGWIKGQPVRYIARHHYGHAKRQPLADRFWPKVDKNGPVPAHRPDLGPCWVWTGSRRRFGYGQFNDGTTTPAGAHRVAYELLIGPIPDGLDLDHLCRNPPCVNPAHLEPVTSRVNILRGTSPMALNAVATHCVRGHAFDEANTYITPSGGRNCRRCRAMAERARRARVREAPRASG